jgi:vacuolar iron transporter family protein
VTAVVVGGGAVVTEATAGVLIGGPPLRCGLRRLAVGVAAAAMTCGVGRVFGTVVGCPPARRSPFQALSAGSR